MKINEIYTFPLKLTKYVKYTFSIFKLAIISFRFLAWSAINQEYIEPYATLITSEPYTHNNKWLPINL